MGGGGGGGKMALPEEVEEKEPAVTPEAEEEHQVLGLVELPSPPPPPSLSSSPVEALDEEFKKLTLDEVEAVDRQDSGLGDESKANLVGEEIWNGEEEIVWTAGNNWKEENNGWNEETNGWNGDGNDWKEENNGWNEETNGWNGDGNDWKEEYIGRNEETTEEGKESRKNYRNSRSQNYKSGRSHYHQKPNEPDCPYYLKTGQCRYGLNCKFNHPLTRKKNQPRTGNSSEPLQAVKGKKNEEFPEKTVQCKFYLTPGSCKYGESCRFIHQENAEDASGEVNFLGLPIRLGERECPFYMRNGSCKFGSNCRFHHPDPTAIGGRDPLSEYQTGSSSHVHGTTQLSMPISFLDASPSYAGTYFPPQAPVHIHEWNGYQGPIDPMFPPERSRQHPSLPTVTDQLQMHVDVFPERPGEPECHFFMKSGDCKFKSACKFHHPKTRPCLSPKGYPLRPDRPICTNYSRFGICKFGLACKFDHPNDCGTPQSSSPGAF